MKVSIAAGITIIFVALAVALSVGVVVWGLQSKEFLNKKGTLNYDVHDTLVAVKAYASSNNGTLPSSIRDPMLGQYLEEWPVNPFTDEQLLLVSKGCFQDPNDVELVVIDTEHEKGHYLSTTLTAYRSNGAVLVRSGPAIFELE